MRTVLFVALYGLQAFAADQPVRQMFTLAVSGGSVPVFRHGYVLIFPPPARSGPSNGFAAYGPDGKLAFDTVIEVPGGSHSAVGEVDFDENGNAAVGANAIGSSSQHLFGIVLLDRAGRQTGFIDTGLYVPIHLAIAPDHSIWTLGWKKSDDGSGEEDRSDYMLVRQFSFDGKLLQSVLPRSLFSKGIAPAIDGGIRVTADRVGVATKSRFPGAPAFREWIELDLKGDVRDRLEMPPNLWAHDFAFTADDGVHFWVTGGTSNFKLDTASRSWKSFPAHDSLLMGADGNHLVYGKTGPGPVELQWFDQP